jgi:hypothetical protein
MRCQCTHVVCLDLGADPSFGARKYRWLSAQIVHLRQEAVVRDQSAARLGPAGQAAKAGKASHLQAEATACVNTHGGLRLAQAHVCQQPQ